MFVCINICSGFTVTNWWVFASWRPALIVTSLSIMLSVLLIFLMFLDVDQYFVSLSISETRFQTWSTGADISWLTLIGSNEVAMAWGIYHAVVITTKAITMTADIVVSAFLLTRFLNLLFLSLWNRRGWILVITIVYLWHIT
jgi:hypothetical protein